MDRGLRHATAIKTESIVLRGLSSLEKRTTDEITKRIDIPTPTVHAVLERLCIKNIVEKSIKKDGTVGRPKRVWFIKEGITIFFNDHAYSIKQEK